MNLSFARKLALVAALLPLGAAGPAACHPQPVPATPPPAPAADDKPPRGHVERLEPALDALVPTDARVEVLAEGFQWAEGPVWRNGELLFSDVPRNRILAWQEGPGVSVFLEPSGYTGTAARGGEPGSNGLAVDKNGKLVLCQHGDRRVVRLEGEGKFVTLAARYKGKRLNSPNDLAIRKNGEIYFTDPPYGLEGHEKDPKKELAWSGVYRVGSKGGEVVLLTKELKYPNGIAFSPDEKTLYVSNSDPDRAIWMAYEVKRDGGIGKGRVFFDATEAVKAGKQGLPDGMKVDVDGNLFATGPGGVYVFSPDGKHLGTIDTGTKTANCAFGNDGSTLYMTANNMICRVRLSTKGPVAAK
jgi:gluconolactonase